MEIRVWDYLDEYAMEREDILNAVDNVFKSGVLILGENVRKFESEFASYCESEHGIGVDNATNGIFLSLKALGIGAGDEVITVSNTAVPTVSAIAQAGATPRFVDIEPDTGLMDVSLVEAAINPKTRCVIPVHLFGQCVDMISLKAICDKHSLSIVEDCSQSHGARHNGRVCGSFGDMAVFSFYPTKTLGGYGDGGLVIARTSYYDEKLRRLRFYGMKDVYYAEELGYNSRLDEVQAAILRLKLKRLDSYILRRQKIADRYHQILNCTSLKLPVVARGNEHVFYVYVVSHLERDRLINELKLKGIKLNISYPWPIHTMRGFEYLGGKEGDLPNTEAASKVIFSLPMYPSLTEQSQDTVCRAIGDILGERVSL